MRQAKAPSQRQLRVGELIRHALADILNRGEVSDPDLDGRAITVLEVAMTPDLKHATAYVRPLVDADSEAVMAGLDRSRKRFRSALAPRVRLKFLPDLRFRRDTSLDYARKVDAILARPDVARDLDAGED